MLISLSRRPSTGSIPPDTSVNIDAPQKGAAFPAVGALGGLGLQADRDEALKVTVDRPINEDHFGLNLFSPEEDDNYVELDQIVPAPRTPYFAPTSSHVTDPTGAVIIDVRTRRKGERAISIIPEIEMPQTTVHLNELITPKQKQLQANKAADKFIDKAKTLKIEQPKLSKIIVGGSCLSLGIGFEIILGVLNSVGVDIGNLAVACPFSGSGLIAFSIIGFFICLYFGLRTYDYVFNFNNKETIKLARKIYLKGIERDTEDETLNGTYDKYQKRLRNIPDMKSKTDRTDEDLKAEKDFKKDPSKFSEKMNELPAEMHLLSNNNHESILMLIDYALKQQGASRKEINQILDSQILERFKFELYFKLDAKFYETHKNIIAGNRTILDIIKRREKFGLWYTLYATYLAGTGFDLNRSKIFLGEIGRVELLCARIFGRAYAKIWLPILKILNRTSDEAQNQSQRNNLYHSNYLGEADSLSSISFTPPNSPAEVHLDNSPSRDKKTN